MRKVIRASTLATLLLVAGVFFPISPATQQVPKELQPPADEQLILQVHAKGSQIYTCKSDGAQFIWSFKAPDAELFDKDAKPFGKHFAGPTWEANDGSHVTGKAVANVPSPDPWSIPWLLLTVASRGGDGALARVTSIQRINTKGGNAPNGGCEAKEVGWERRAPYTADYVFFAPK